jgi:hypothetical protein
MAADRIAASAAIRENRATLHPAILSISTSLIQETRSSGCQESDDDRGRFEISARIPERTPILAAGRDPGWRQGCAAG